MKVLIVGGSGYTGRELLRILSKHKKVDSIQVTSRKYAGQCVSDVHKSLKGMCDVRFTSFDAAGSDADIVFLAVPHTEAMKYAPSLLKSNLLVVDLSADFRLKDPDVYERHYKVKHICPELICKSVYGLPEYYRDGVRKARLVANPGCYPTSVILAAKPLLDGFKVDEIVVDSKSGVSGAGVKKEEEMRKFIDERNFKAYKVTSHQHVPEMEQELGRGIHFTPHLLPFEQGIFTTIHAFTDADAEEVKGAYVRKYSAEPFVKLVDDPDVLSVRDTNYCHIGGFKKDGRRLVITSALDNLIKGASGQAVENMNLMMGYDETEGLNTIPPYR
jgi:N-acetyl-gamma-glutamyl-phosphate reductase